MTLLSFLLSFALITGSSDDSTKTNEDEPQGPLVEISGPSVVCLNTSLTYTAVISSSVGTCSSPQGFTYNWQSFNGSYQTIAGGTYSDNYITVKYTSAVTNMSLVVSVSCSSASIGSKSMQGIHSVTLTSPSVNSAGRCGTGSVVLNATAPTSAESTVSVIWYAQSSGGTALFTGAQFTTPSLSTTTTYYVSSYYNNYTSNCRESARVPVVATISGTPNAPSSSGGSTRCGPGVVSLQATGESSGIKWYAQATGGSPIATTQGATGNWATPSLSQTTDYYMTSYNSDGCESTPRTLITAIIYTVPNPQVSNASVCENGSITLNASISDPGFNSIRWWNSATGGTELSSTFITNLNTTTNYYAEGYNSYISCSSGARIPLTVSVNSKPSPPNTISGNARFESGTLNLTASGSSAVTYEWFRPSDNMLLYQGSVYPTPSVNNSVSNYVYVKGKSSEGCYSDAFYTDALIYPKPVIVSNSMRVAMGSSVTISTTPDYGTYQWSRNGQVISSANVNSLSVNNSGDYVVTVTKASVIGSSTSYPIRISSQMEGVNMNYVIDNTVLTESVIDADQVDNMNVKSRTQAINYFDGLGRPVQSIITQGSPESNDVVQPIVYDDVGREYRKYLPYVSQEKNGIYKTNPLAGQASFYATTSTLPFDNAPYAETKFESSPLNRVIKQGSPGTVWQPNGDMFDLSDRTVKSKYELNKAAEVYYFSFNITTGMLETMAGNFYSIDQLYKYVSYDESNNQIISFTDKEGRMICKKVQSGGSSTSPQFASTYYVYDDFGNLVLVLPPEGVEKLKTALNLN